MTPNHKYRAGLESLCLQRCLAIAAWRFELQKVALSKVSSGICYRPIFPGYMCKSMYTFRF